MRKIKLPLEMANGVKVRTLEELRENWDLEKILNYYLNGKLQTWLSDRYYNDLAEKVAELKNECDNALLQKELCNIFAVEETNEVIDVEIVAERNRRLNLLRQYTADDEILKNIDKVAFNQEDLANLLDKGESTIYLFNNTFSLPLEIKNKKYIGVGEVELQINSNEYVDFDELGIRLVNTKFNEEYERLYNSDKVLYKKGEELESADRFVEALECYKKAGSLGNANALYKVGLFYREGRKGIDKNYGMAQEFYKKAIQLENVAAMNDLGSMYFNGNGIKQNYKEAMSWYKIAASLDNDVAMSNLGNIYYYGYGVKKDYTKAISWYKKAADLDNANALNKLGRIYFYGDGISKDVEKGNKLLQKAAELGNIDACGLLGTVYEGYYGIHTRNNEWNEANNAWNEAVKWYKKAADLGDILAIRSVGYMYNLVGDYMESQKWLEKAEELEKNKECK